MTIFRLYLLLGNPSKRGLDPTSNTNKQVVAYPQQHRIDTFPYYHLTSQSLWPIPPTHQPNASHTIVPPPPRRPDETRHGHFVRWKAHRDAWRQQFLDDYYRQKETRLPSPNSEDDFDEEEVLQEVQFIERCIRLESGHPEPGDLPTRVEWPRVEYPPGKSLSEVSEYEPSPWSPIKRRRPEDDECHPRPIFQSPSLVPRPETTPTRKRSSSSAEEDALEPQAKKRKTDASPDIPPEVPTITSPKKRKTDTHNLPAPASMTPISKRKRESDTDETHEHEVPAPSQPGWRVTGAKRRRVDEETTTSDAGDRRDRNRKSRNVREQAAATSSS